MMDQCMCTLVYSPAWHTSMIVRGVLHVEAWDLEIDQEVSEQDFR